jgi:predicted DsbA family dithiol-disulfide isomerase
LVDVASAAGLDPEAVRTLIAGDAWSAEVRADEHEATELGVTGVPYFLINGKWAIPGAQDVETIGLLLRRAWERTEVATA